MTFPLCQVPGVQRRKFGDIVVTALNDGFIMLPVNAVRGIADEDCEALYRAAGRRPPFATSINAYLVQSSDRAVLVDTGCGRFMGPRLGRLPANLRAADMTPEEIDSVVITHMHTDHVGGLLSGENTAVYQRARLILSAQELAYWTDRSNYDSSPESTRDSFDIVQRVVGAYDGRIDTFEGATQITPAIRSLPLNGHTPGHTGYEIGVGSTPLIIWGDVSHAPELQFVRPDITVVFDVDPEEAIHARRMIMERAVIEDIMIAGMHIPFPGFTRIARSGEAYASHPQVWQYELLG
jgi:glyoxylase-like metal-dependent hydrolase (beta-lactamase superfamily II)